MVFVVLFCIDDNRKYRQTLDPVTACGRFASSHAKILIWQLASAYHSLALTSKEFAYYDHWLFMTARVLQPTLIRLCWLAGVFCQPVQCACAKMTSRVGKHKTFNRKRYNGVCCFVFLFCLFVFVLFCFGFFMLVFNRQAKKLFNMYCISK